MGFFKDLNRLSKQAKEIDETYDAGAQAQQGLAQMRQMNQMLQQQAQATNVATTGAPAQVQITGSRDTGTVMNMQPVLQIDVLVVPDGGVPFPTTLSQVVPMAALPRVVPGASFAGRVDPSTPGAVWIDWGS